MYRLTHTETTKKIIKNIPKEKYENIYQKKNMKIYTKRKIWKYIPKEKYENIISGAYKRPEKYVNKISNRVRKLKEYL